MILLRNFDCATKYYNYSSRTEISEDSILKINGWYKFINGLLSALLVIDNNLYFLYGEDTILIKESYTVLLGGSSNTKREFSLVDGSDILVKFLYNLPDPKFNVSPFEYIDEDDFRWGDFIAKVINDKERRRSFVENLMENW